MKDNKNFLDYLYCFMDGLKEDIKEFGNDFTKYLKRKFKRKNINNVEHQRRTKNSSSAIRYMFTIIILAFLGALIITLNSFINDFININSNKVKCIYIYNYIQNDKAKMMTVDDRKGIESVCSLLNEIKESKIKNEIDDVFVTEEKENDNKLSMIIRIEYKKKTDVINIFGNKIKYKKKEIEFENNVDSLWLKLNYKISDAILTDYENYIIK